MRPSGAGTSVLGSALFCIYLRHSTLLLDPCGSRRRHSVAVSAERWGSLLSRAGCAVFG
jgi:hypothetical protein